MEIIHPLVWSLHRRSIVTQEQRDSFLFRSDDRNLINRVFR